MFKDNITNLSKAINYLEKNSECHNQNMCSEPSLQDLILMESENKSQTELYSFAAVSGA
jgi:hypothetical protein